MTWFRKQRPDLWEPQERFGGLSEADVNTLGYYNAERGRGIMHTPAWQAQMAALQARFDAGEQGRYRRRVAGLES